MLVECQYNPKNYLADDLCVCAISIKSAPNFSSIAFRW